MWWDVLWCVLEVIGIVGGALFLHVVLGAVGL